jgi:hypothetical protein
MHKPTLRIAAFAFLALASTAVHAAAQNNYQPIGTFVVSHDADPISDEDHSNAVVSSTDSTAVLWWQCYGDTGTAVFVTFQTPPKTETMDAVYRFDQDAPDTTSLPSDVDKDGQRWFEFPPEEVFGISTRAMTAGRVVLRVWDEDDTYRDFFFPLNGGGRALRSLGCVGQLRPPVLGQPAQKREGKPH